MRARLESGARCDVWAGLICQTTFLQIPRHRASLITDDARLSRLKLASQGTLILIWARQSQKSTLPSDKIMRAAAGVE